LKKENVGETTERQDMLQTLKIGPRETEKRDGTRADLSSSLLFLLTILDAFWA
jgi:hypothetical protein